MSATLTAILLAAVWGCDPVRSWRYPENEANGWGPACRQGTEQSPIDILHGDKGTTTPANFEPLVFVNYDTPLAFNLSNNGHTALLAAESPCAVAVTGGGLRKLFKLDQMHFHWGSEHLVNGYRYPLELHLVHYDANYPSFQEALGKNNTIAVIAVLFRQDKSDVPNVELSHVVAGVRGVAAQPGRQVPLSARLSPGSLLPTDTWSWWRYAGSLTTPSCDQGVLWTVFRDTLPVARDQIKEFQKMQQPGASPSAGQEYLLKNFRAPQPAKQRLVLYQDPSHAEAGAGTVAATTLTAVLTLSLLASFGHPLSDGIAI